MATALVAIMLFSIPLGPYPVEVGDVVRVLAARALGGDSGVADTAEVVVMQVRLPRILGAALVGGALAAAGAAYQSIFRNPLVSPAILGVSAGAGFGAALGILVQSTWPIVQLWAFAFGMVAALLAITIARLLGGGSTIVLVLAGMVVSTLFQALISITQYRANPDDTLSAITFWLMGGLGRITLGNLAGPALIFLGCLTVLYLIRWQITLLAAGDDEALSLGVNRQVIFAVVIIAASLMTATAVSIAGIVGWIGLVVPHLARFIVGPSFDRLLPVAVMMGAGFLVLVDDIARNSGEMELPLGVLTALIGAPFFVLLLARARTQWL